MINKFHNYIISIFNKLILNLKNKFFIFKLLLLITIFSLLSVSIITENFSDKNIGFIIGSYFGRFLLAYILVFGGSKIINAVRKGDDISTIELFK